MNSLTSYAEYLESVVVSLLRERQYEHRKFGNIMIDDENAPASMRGFEVTVYNLQKEIREQREKRKSK